MKKMIVAICITVALLITGIITTIIIINTPSIIMAPTVSSAIGDFFKRDDIKQLQSVLENGSVEFDVLDEEKGIDASGKIYLNLDDYKLMAENIDVKYGDVSLSGNFYAGPNLCCAENESILGGTVGIKSGTAAEEFEKSIFAFGSGSEYAVDKETHDIIYELLSAYDEKLYDDIKKDSDKLKAKYLSKIQSCISKYGKFSSKNVNTKVGTSQMDARLMTLVLDEAAVSGIISDFLTFVAEDETFKDFVLNYGYKFDGILKSRGFDSAEAFYNEIIKEINGRIENISDETKGTSIEFSVITPRLSTKLLAFTLKLNENGKTRTYSVDFGKEGIRNSDHITFNMNGTLIEYKRGSDTKSFSLVVEDFAKFTYYLDGEGGFKLALLLFYEGEERYEISGTVTTDKKLTSYSITNYKYTYNKDSVGEFENIIEKDLNIQVNVSSKDKMPSLLAEEYDQFFALDEENYEAMKENVLAIFGKEENEE